MTEHPQPRWFDKATHPLVALAVIAAGFAAIIGGYFGVSGTPLVAKQLPYLISGGLAGIALVFVGGLLLGVRDLARLASRIDGSEEQVNELHAVLLTAAGEFADRPEGALAGAPDDVVVVLNGGKTAHRPTCSVVAGKEGLQTLSLAAVEASGNGLRPCKLCDPPLAGTPQS